MKLILLVALFSVVAHVYCANDGEAKSGNVEIKVKGQSGKITFMTKRTNSTKKTSVTFEMDSITELDSAGKAVGTSGSTKHSFKSFATQDFVFIPTTDTLYKGIKAMGFDFETTIISAKLLISVNILKENGTIGNDDEEIQVTEGSLKIDIAIRNWTYCNPCKKGNVDEKGESLELSIIVKRDGKEKATKTKKKSNKKAGKKSADVYDLGDNTEIILSQKYKNGDTWMNMIDGYPKLDTAGGKQRILFRFGNSSTDISYDPVIQSTTEGEDDNAGTTPSYGKMMIFIAVLFQIFVSYSNFFS